MTPQRYQQLMELFDRAPRGASATQSSFVAGVRADDPGLADELLALLAHDGTRGDFLDSHAGRLELAARVPSLTDAPTAPESGGPGPGAVIDDRFELAERLGSGATGHVYRAHDRVLDRDVAIKLLRAHLVHEPHQVARFRREFRAIARIDHPGCLKVFAEGGHGAQRYIVMEYVASGNLGRLVGAGSDVLLPVLIELAEALDCVHRHGIIHRDLKPANVLLAPGAPITPKLADFGIVKLVGDVSTRLTETGAVLGTIDYLSPEALANEPLDPRADLYSLGCVMFQLWAGRPPFSGGPLERLRARADRGALPLRAAAPEAPEAVERLVARLLERSPAKRPRRAADVARELRAISVAASRGAHPPRYTARGTAPRAIRTADPALAAATVSEYEAPGATGSAREAPGAPAGASVGQPTVDAARAVTRAAAVCSAPALAPSGDGDAARLFHDLRDAGRASLQARDHASARDHLRHALALADHLAVDDREPARLECRELLADALVVTGDAPGAAELLRALVSTPAPMATRVRWLRKLGMALLRTRELAAALTTLERGLAVAGHALPRGGLAVRWRVVRDIVLTAVRRVLRRAPVRDPVDEEVAAIHRELAMMNRWIDLDRAAAHLAAFVRLAHRLGVVALLVDAYTGIGFLQALRSWTVLAARSHHRARTLALGAGDMQRLARLELVCGATEVATRGDEEVACAHFDRGVELAEASGDRFLESFAFSMRGTGAALLGRWRQGLDDFRHAAALATELGVAWLEAEAMCGRGALELMFGEAAHASRNARQVLGSDDRVVLPALEGGALEVLALEALFQGRFRDAVVQFDRAHHAYAVHDLYRAWGVLTKVAHCEAALCLADEQGIDAVPDLLDRLHRAARYARRRLNHSPLHRGHDLLLRGVHASRKGDTAAARRLFTELRAARSATRSGLMDLWIEARLAFERLRLGDARADVAADLDDLAGTYEAAGLRGIGGWLSRMRAIHAI